MTNKLLHDHMLNINLNDKFRCKTSYYHKGVVQYKYNHIYTSNYPNTIENEYKNDLLWNGDWINYFEKICY